ncbi:hypothetical protein CY34DRAFT_574479 [Suillus luteus UH-Slu-Lm8-n1]|uniref:Uncharacterized protein n=1 Tax=Suillus luteus UH-Slu-Lm8-n1 TaxID=930992 RepID=A0A0D0A0Z1_9AGAM|nr:hypothetical protein CY34DRAFT_574479 [Suillus luteus UH-Slu-Lm8-n1]
MYGHQITVLYRSAGIADMHPSEGTTTTLRKCPRRYCCFSSATSIGNGADKCYIYCSHDRQCNICPERPGHCYCDAREETRQTNETTQLVDSDCRRRTLKV